MASVSGYTKKAIQQAVDSGMNPKEARRLVNSNVQHQQNAQRLRTSGRNAYVERILGR